MLVQLDTGGPAAVIGVLSISTGWLGLWVGALPTLSVAVTVKLRLPSGSAVLMTVAAERQPQVVRFW
jgi:hypothetical protein